MAKLLYIVPALILFFLPIQVFAQEYLTYENPEHGFSIEYPTDWEVTEDKIMLNTEGGVVKFTSPDMPSLTIAVRNVSQYLDTNTLTLKSRTAQDYVLESKAEMSNYQGMGFREISNNETRVADNPAWRLDYILTLLEFGVGFYHNDIYTIKDNKVYSFEYSSSPLEVPANLPIANRMIDSFKFLASK